MKYHNFFEKKEREYRNKILEYFGSKKIQNENKMEEKEYNIIPNDENGENKDTDDNKYKLCSYKLPHCETCSLNSNNQFFPIKKNYFKITYKFLIKPY